MKSRRIVLRHPRKTEPILWVIDSEQWPRVCLRAELIERGYDPYGFITIGDALDSFSRGAAAKPRLIILELRGQDVTEPVINDVRNLHVPIIVLGGSAELNEPLVQHRQWEAVFRRPVFLGRIADAAQHILSEKRTAA